MDVSGLLLPLQAPAHPHTPQTRRCLHHREGPREGPVTAAGARPAHAQARRAALLPPTKHHAKQGSRVHQGRIRHARRAQSVISLPLLRVRQNLVGGAKLLQQQQQQQGRRQKVNASGWQVARLPKSRGQAERRRGGGARRVGAAGAKCAGAGTPCVPGSVPWRLGRWGSCLGGTAARGAAGAVSAAALHWRHAPAAGCRQRSGGPTSRARM